MGDQAELDQCPESVKEALENGDDALIAEKVKEYLEKQEQVPLNIAVTGESGSGKSSFVNAFRGVDNKDENAAATGCVETTTEVKSYNHPKYPNVTLWDLPGIGTTKFRADEYLEHVEFKKFDFFIIISADRFRENDAKLAQEIQKMEKKFYFVRTKIDHNMQDEERSQRDFNEENTLDRIRKNCTEGLEKLHIPSPKVFLISNFEPHQYGFERLCHTLEEELPQHQQHVLLLALPNISQEICNKKRKILKAKIKYCALMSAVGAAVPVPGTSVAVDGGITLKFVRKCQDVFHVDGVKLLHSVIKEPVESGKKVTVDLILRVLSSSVVFTSLIVAEEGTRFIPIFGIPIAMALSSIATYTALTFFLDKFTEAAQKANMKAVGLGTQV
uniref:IRG-type G domain-containing protein n=1 Tax=Sphaeramia orbicularis TaxID=375764 RepID=A0A673CBH9_9TELE